MKKKLERFAGVVFPDGADLTSYIFREQYASGDFKQYVVKIAGKEAAFFGKYSTPEELYERAMTFINMLRDTSKLTGTPLELQTPN